MYLNVLTAMKNISIIKFYLNNRTFILGVAILCLFLIFTITLIVQLYNDKLERVIKSDILIKDTVIIVSALLLGMLLNVAGMKIVLKLDCVPILVFFYSSILIFLIQGIEYVRCKNTHREIVKKTLNLYIQLIEIIMLLLMVMDRLDSIEFVAMIMLIMILRLYTFLLEDDEKFPITNVGILKEDYPVRQVNELFESRQRQLNSICVELEQFHESYESFAVAISGKWGTGKTSFINALENKIDQAVFVHVGCAIGCDIKAILNEMAFQITDIFKKNGIYSSKNGIIEQYFNKISSFISDMGYDKLSKILQVFDNNKEQSYFEVKKLMNEELKNFYSITKKTIYFIIDDMDRVIDDDMKNLLFQIVRECVDLNYCVTLFLMDYDQLTEGKLGEVFFEKYVNYQYKLCEVSYQEIVNNYFKVYLTDDFFAEFSEYMRNRIEEIRKYTLKIGNEIIEYITKHIGKLKKDAEKNEENQEKNQKKINRLINTKENLRGRLKNPRKVKRYLNNIEKMLSIADLVWFKKENFETNEYSKEPWINYIIKISFMKAFLSEVYEAMIQSGSFYVFQEIDELNYYITEQIIFEFHNEISGLGMNGVLEKLVYHLYILDTELYISEHQTLLEEIDNKNLDERNLLQYIDICMGIEIDFNRLFVVMDFIDKNLLDDKYYLNEIIKKIINKLYFNDENLKQERFIEVFTKLKNIIDKNLYQIDRNIIKEFQSKKKQEFIMKYNGYINLVFNIIYERSEDTKNQVNSISDLYHYVDRKRVKKNNYFGECIEDDSIQIGYLKNYFKHIKDELKQEAFMDVKEQGLFFLNLIETALEALDILFKIKVEPFYDIDNLDYKKGKRFILRWIFNPHKLCHNNC